MALRHKPTATRRQLEEARREAEKWRQEAEAVRELMHRKVTALEQAHDARLAELSHQARSDLAAVIALIELKAMAAGEPAIRDVLMAMAQRVRALTLIQAQVRLEPQGGHLGVDSRALLERLVEGLHRAVGCCGAVELEVKAERHLLSLELAMSLGLIANELVSNALEHCLPERPPRQGGRAVRPGR